MKRLTSQHKAKVYITEKLQSQITVLHNQCPTKKEWSGLLLFKVLKGSIEHPEDLEISCEEAFVMDFGDSSFTSFEASSDWITFFEKFPQIDPTNRNEQNKDWYIGKIHSHHSMDAFHSGTDTQDLYENAPKLPFFLSLVVNYNCTPFAEIGVAGEEEERSITRTTFSLKNLIGKNKKIDKKDTKSPVTLVISCDVVYYTQQWILDQINVVRDKVKASAAAAASSYQSSYAGGMGFQRQQPPVDTYVNKHTRKSSPFGYRTVLDSLSDLFLLGTCKQTAMLPPALVYNHIDDILSVANVDKYLDAVKYHFHKNWFKNNLSKTAVSEKNAIECIEYFLDTDAVHYQWLTQQFIQSLDDLKKEIELLRKVQGHAVV